MSSKKRVTSHKNQIRKPGIPKRILSVLVTISLIVMFPMTGLSSFADEIIAPPEGMVEYGGDEGEPTGDDPGEGGLGDLGETILGEPPGGFIDIFGLEGELELGEPPAAGPIEIMPLGGPIGGDNTRVTVDNWAELVAAVGNPVVVYIEFSTNIARTGGDTAGNDLPAINRSLTINGDGKTLDLRGSSTTIARKTFQLNNGAPAGSQFTLQNIDIIRPNGGTSQLISAFTTNTTANSNSNASGTGASWTVNLHNVDGNAAGPAPSGGIVTIPGGSVNVTGNLTWDNSPNSTGGDQAIINARYQTYDAAKVFIKGNNTGTTNGLVCAQHNDNSASNIRGSWIKVINGADVYIENTTRADTSTIIVGNYGVGSVAEIFVDNATLEVHGNESGYDYRGVISLWGESSAGGQGGGGINITNGGVLKAYDDNPSGGITILQRIESGQFNVSGEGSELYAISNTHTSGYAGTVRFYLVGNQELNISDKAKVTIIKRTPATGSNNGDCPAIRFGTGTGNSFTVTGGATVEIINDGGTGAASTTASSLNAKAAIAYAANNWSFEISGEKSSVKLYAAKGAAVAAGGQNNGSITLGKGAIFIAEGNINDTRDVAATNGIFTTGTNFTFSADEPLYYDFANMSPNSQVRVFSVGSGSSLSSKNSDLAVWGNGNNRDGSGNGGTNSSNNPISGNPARSWSLVTYTLSGTNMATLASPDTPYLSSVPRDPDGQINFGNQGMRPYRRISGNNATPAFQEIERLTNADKFVRVIGVVPEGLEEPRPLWDGEVFGRFEITHNGTTSLSQPGETVSLRDESIYTVETGVDNLEGVLRYTKPGGEFLYPGDKYELISAWRGVEDTYPVSPRVHVAIPEELPQYAATVEDVLPPVPAGITTPNNNKMWIGVTSEIKGTWTPNQALAEPHNPEPAVKIYAVVNSADNVITEGGSTVYGTLNGDGTWEYTVPASALSSLSEGDEVYFILEDANGNANPLVDTAIRDTTKLAAPYLTVSQPDLALTAKDAVIGLIEAREIAALGQNNPAQFEALKDLINAQATKSTETTLREIVEVSECDPYWDNVDYYDRDEFALAHPTGKIYTVKYQAVDDPTIYKYATVKVEPTETAYIDAHDFTMSVNNAITMMSKSQPARDAQLIAEAEAKARKLLTDTEWSSDNVEVISVSIPDPAMMTAGDYAVTFHVKDMPDAKEYKVTIIAHIIPGNVPVIEIDGPILVWIGDPAEPFISDTPSGNRPDGSILPSELTDAKYKEGVRAWDSFGSSFDITDRITYDASAVDLTKRGLYSVRYTVTNDDDNTATAYRVVSVGIVIWDDGYGLDATSFVKNIDAINASEAAILADSRAYAFKIDESDPSGFTSATARLVSPGLYGTGSPVGTYPVTLGVVGSTNTLVIDAVVVKKDKITDADNPVDNIRYTIAANDVTITVPEAAGFSGMDPDVQLKLINESVAEAWRLETRSTHLGSASYPLTSLDSAGVFVVSNNIPASGGSAGDSYTVTFGIKDVPSIRVQVTYLLFGTPPVITFLEEPLVIKFQDSASAHNLTDTEMKAEMTVIDAEDGDIRLTSKTTYTVNGSPTATINTGNVGVYKVVYTAIDSDGMDATATRAIVIDDGRFEIDKVNGVILGAKNFVAMSKDVNGSLGQVRNWSRAVAFEIDGTTINATEVVVTPFPPAGYTVPCPEGEYKFTWMVTGYPTTKTITGYITDADVIFPGGDNDQYAMTANHFQVNTADANAMMGPGLNAALIAKSEVKVIKLVDSADNAIPFVIATGGFGPTEADYPLAFGAWNTVKDSAVLTSPSTRVDPIGTVSDGNRPVITLSTPIEVWIGETAAPAGAITREQYEAVLGDMYGVTADDVEDGDLTDEVIVSFVPPTTAVDLNTPGIYKLKFDVQDSDFQWAISKYRVVVVNDGSYKVGNGRILYARSFVTRLTDVGANINNDILDKSQAKLFDGTYGNEIGLAGNISDIYPGSYGPSKGIHNITIEAHDSPSGTISKTIVGEVTDATVVGPDIPPPYGSVTWVFGTPAKQTVVEAETTAALGAAEVIEVLQASASKYLANGTRVSPPPAVKIFEDTDNYLTTFTTGTKAMGIYRFIISDVDEVTKINLTIQVGSGYDDLFISATPKPLAIDMPVAAGSIDGSGNLTHAKLMEGVVATDVKEIDTGNPTGDVRDLVTISIVDAETDAGVSYIPADKAGIYRVTYSYEDENYLTVSDTRAVFVNDGRYVYDSSYILKALNYVVPYSVANGSSTEILTLSEARAWDTNGQPRSASVNDNGGYTRMPGDYTAIVIQVQGYGTLQKTIQAKVLDDRSTAVPNTNSNGANGESTSVVAHNFRINVIDANAHAGKAITDPAAYRELFFTKSELAFYDRTALSFGTASVTRAMTSDGGFATSGALTQGQQFTITFACPEDPDASTTITVFIDNGQPPVITAPIRIIWVGEGPAPAGTIMPSDWTGSGGKIGVTVTDDYDMDIQSKLKIGSMSTGSFVEGDPLKMTEDMYNVWQDVSYSATDSDYNTTVETFKVMLTTFPLYGDYLPMGYSFVKLKGSVDTSNTTIMTDSYAKLWRVAATDPDPVDVTELLYVDTKGGYTDAVGDYTIHFESGTPQVGYTGHAVMDLTAKVVERDAIGDGFNTAGGIRYTVVASNGLVDLKDADLVRNGAGTAETLLVTAAGALAWQIPDSRLYFWGVTVVDNPIGTTGYEIKPNGVYPVTFAPVGQPHITVTVDITLSSGNYPVISFQQKPLVFNQTATSTPITTAMLKQYMTVTDVEDNALGIDLMPLTNVTVGAGGITLDQHNLGVWKVTYTVTDSDKNTTTAYRAVVITDGRYEWDEADDIIIGARDYVAKSGGSFQASEGEARSMSYAEAYTFIGDLIPSDQVTWTGRPTGYTATAAEGDYPITWQVDGRTKKKDIVAHITEAEVIDVGTKDSTYAIEASSFWVNQEDARDIQTAGQPGFIAAAKVKVTKLVPSAPDRDALLTSTAGFDPNVEATYYPITFRIDGIPATEQSVGIRGTVSQGKPPVIYAPTPLHVWIGPAADKPAGAITAAEYDDFYNVTADDEEDGDLTADVTVTGTVDLTTEGDYKLTYDVVDSDGNHPVKVTTRMVIVNEGTYEVGTDRYMRANSFVILLKDVASSPAARETQILLNSSAAVYNGETGEPISSTELFVEDDDGYGPIEKIFNVVIGADDTATTSIYKGIEVEVVDAEIHIEEPVYTMVGNNIEMELYEATAIQTAADRDKALIDAIGGRAFKALPNGTLDHLTVVINNDGGFTDAVGTYYVTLADSGNNISYAFRVRVGATELPWIVFDSMPLAYDFIEGSVDNLTRDDIMKDVTAWAKDITGATYDLTDRIIINPNASGVEVLPTIPWGEASVTQITYSVTGDNGFTTTESRALIVNDDSIIFDPNYILRGRSFIIEAKDVTGDLNELLLLKSGARAWKSDGTPATAIVADTGGFKAEQGDWNVRLGIAGYTALTRNITAKVTDGIPGNGDRYSILAYNFRINETDAAALQGLSGAAYDSVFITRAGAKSYLRTDPALPLGGTVAMTNDGGFKTSSFLHKGDAGYPSTYSITFWVDEDHSATCTITMSVDNGDPPVISAPTRIIWVGDGPAPAGMILPSEWYASGGKIGVSVWDDYDADVASTLKIGSMSTGSWVDGDPLKMTEDMYNVFQDVSYYAIDFDGNETIVTSKVMVTPQPLVGDYLLIGYSFVKLKGDVDTGDSAILFDTHAKLWRVAATDPVPVDATHLLYVDTKGGYADAVGEYTIHLESLTPEPGYEGHVARDFTAKVVERDAIGDGFNASGGTRYTVVASNGMVSWDDRFLVTGTGTEATSRLVAAAGALAWQIPDASLNNWGVVLVDNPIGTTSPYEPNGVYPVTFAPAGQPHITVTVDITLSSGNYPVISFQQKPLVFNQTATSTPITTAMLKQYMTVTDVEDNALGIDLMPLTNVTVGAGGITLDQHNLGVWKVTYTVTDTHNNTTTAYRAVVITDGRYEWDEADDIIIGARDYVAKSGGSFQASEGEARSMSYAEAFTFIGDLIPSDQVTWTGRPTGYTATAAEGDYPITWQVDGRTKKKDIVAHITEAEVIDVGTKDSTYAIEASSFWVNQEDARDIQTAGQPGFIAAAKVKVTKLVPSAPDRDALLTSTAGFDPNVEATYYPITFRIDGIPATEQSVGIRGTVSQGKPPVIYAPTPLHVWIGPAADKPAGAITAAEYDDFYNVTADDEEDGDLTADVTVTGTVDLTTEGDYKLTYDVVDSDGNHPVKVTTRMVIVNEGTYEVGTDRYMRANSFVILLKDVASSPAARETQILLNSSAAVYNGETGEPISSTELFVEDDDGYGPIEKIFNVVIGADDTATTSIYKGIEVEVVDAEIHIEEPVYTMVGNNIEMELYEATAIQTAADRDKALIDAIGGRAFKALPNGTLDHLTVVINNDGGFTDAVGTYYVTLADSGNNISYAFRVRVGATELPWIVFDSMPLAYDFIEGSVDNLTRDDIMKDVTAWAKDITGATYDLTDRIIINPNASGVEVLPTIPWGEASVTQITYSVTGDNGFTTTESRALIVNDDSIIFDPNYILRGRSFSINVADVTGDLNELLLIESGARAWKSDGTPATAIVADTGGFKAEKGNWNVRLGIATYTALTRNITARVTDATVGNGERYSIEAYDFRINEADAAALQAKIGAAYNAEFITRAGAVSFLRTEPSYPLGGTVAMTNDGGFKTSSFLREGEAGYPSTFSITFWVDEDHSATCTITMTVSQGNHPWIKVPALKSVAIGSVFGDEQYMEGVTYGDVEDDIALLLVTFTRTVNTAVRGIYEVIYTVTDTEGNSASAKSYVLVGYEVDGDYGVTAENFVTTVKNIQDAASLDALILSRSHAAAVHVVRDADDNVIGIEDWPPVVKDNAGLTDAVGSYAPIKIGVAEQPLPIVSITARVIAKDVISNEPDDDGDVNDENTDDPTDTNRYIVAANNVTISWVEAGELEGKSDGVTNARLIALAEAEAMRISSTGTFSGFTVAVSANGIVQDAGDYDVTFIPLGIGGVSVTVTFTVSDHPLPVIGITGPLRIPQTTYSTTVSRTQLLTGVTVTDPACPTLSTADLVITDKTGVAPVINTARAGVTRVTYTIEDLVIKNPDGTPATVSASRVVIINDGRFIEDDDNELLIGAKNFVVSVDDLTFTGSLDDALRLSWAEAYNYDGDEMDIELIGSLPAGFAAKDIGVYSFTFGIVGYTSPVITITGEIVDADVIDEGDDPYNSKYTLIASNFTMDVVDAAAITGDAGLIAAAGARVIKVVAGAPDASVVVHDNGGFTALKGVYPITFGISGYTQAQRSATIEATLTDDTPPTISFSSPLKLALNSTWDRTAAMFEVIAFDLGDGDITSLVTYFDKDPANPVDTSKDGSRYTVVYTVTDSDGNTVEKERSVVVGDRFIFGEYVYMEASSFVILLSDVPANATAIRPHLIAMTDAHVYDNETGAELPQSLLSITSTGGYSRTEGEYDIIVAAKDGPTATISKSVKGRVVDADVIDDEPLDPDDPSGSKVYVYGKNITLRIAEAAALTSDADLLKALKAGAFLTDVNDPKGNLTAQSVIITDKGGFKATPGVYKVKVADVESLCEIELTITVTNGNAPVITPQKPVIVPISDRGGTLTDAQKKGEATAFDIEDGNLTSKIEVIGSVPANVAGVYQVTLKVTDSDGNEVQEKVAVVVDDGNFVYGDEYILYAKDFTIDAADVDNARKTTQILAQTGAYAFKNDGTAARVAVSDIGGYQDKAGVYRPRVYVVELPALTNQVAATVTTPAVMWRVSFNGNGGYLTGPSGIYVAEPSTTIGYLPSSPVRTGYEFLYWSTSPTGGAQFTPDYPVTRNMTVYAQWSKIPDPVPPVTNVYPPNVTVYPPNVYTSSPGVTVTTPPANTYVTVEAPATPTTPPAEEPKPLEIPEDEAPKGITEGPTTHWSLFNVIAVIVSLLLALLFLLRFFMDRRKDDTYDEEAIDWASLSAMTPERRAAVLARLEEDRQAQLDRQRAQERKERSFYVNAPALLIVAAAFIEALIILLTTSDFYAPQVITDSYSVPLSLIVLVQLAVPMIAAMLRNRGKGSSGTGTAGTTLPPQDVSAPTA
ncbi:MAG: DUF5011 domain-containing protein [Coriobacteriia bacterium]|nr:DUF5011 domain-containing protein [Coriobacteriia bacterium]